MGRIWTVAPSIIPGTAATRILQVGPAAEALLCRGPSLSPHLEAWAGMMGVGPVNYGRIAAAMPQCQHKSQCPVEKLRCTKLSESERHVVVLSAAKPTAMSRPEVVMVNFAELCTTLGPRRVMSERICLLRYAGAGEAQGRGDVRRDGRRRRVRACRSRRPRDPR